MTGYADLTEHRTCRLSSDWFVLKGGGACHYKASPFRGVSDMIGWFDNYLPSNKEENFDWVKTVWFQISTFTIYFLFYFIFTENNKTLKINLMQSWISFWKFPQYTYFWLLKLKNFRLQNCRSELQTHEWCKLQTDRQERNAREKCYKSEKNAVITENRSKINKITSNEKCFWWICVCFLCLGVWIINVFAVHIAICWVFVPVSHHGNNQCWWKWCRSRSKQLFVWI